jgi:hypothetical protein
MQKEGQSLVLAIQKVLAKASNRCSTMMSSQVRGKAYERIPCFNLHSGVSVDRTRRSVRKRRKEAATEESAAECWTGAGSRHRRRSLPR